MTTRKPKAPKAQARNKTSMEEDRFMRRAKTVDRPTGIATLVRRAMENPDVRIVLEIAERARDVESREPAKTIGMATDVIAIPTNSQYLV